MIKRDMKYTMKYYNLLHNTRYRNQNINVAKTINEINGNLFLHSLFTGINIIDITS